VLDGGGATFEGIAYQRAARGWGKLFTRKDVEERSPSDLKSLLGTLPAVLINDRGVTFQRCQADLNNLSTALSGGQAGGTTPQPVRLELMEVYTGVARIPAEFLADSCAAIVIWTKAY
jgi:hypothetical protein